jgi:hypothetical protein
MSIAPGRFTPVRITTFVLVAALVVGCGGSTTTNYPAANTVVIGDFNGDGVPDIAVASAVISTTGSVTPNPGYAAIILNTKSSPGTWQPPAHYSFTGSPSGLAVGDLTGSGSLDLVVPAYSEAIVSVLLQTGANTAKFQPAFTVSTGTGTLPNDVALGDLNGDGHLDLAVADGATPGNLIIMMADPVNPGHFLAPTKYALPVGANPNAGFAVAIGDLNGDGLNDVAIVSFDVDGNNGMVSIFFNNPASPGNFMPRVDISTPGEVSSVKIADLNRDGFNDLVIANQGPGQDLNGAAGATVLLQNASAPGTFAAAITYPGTIGSLNVAVGDLNGDGYPDVVLASTVPTGSGTITVMLNDPTNPGTFLAPSTYTGAGQPVAVAIGDLNGDGHPDIAVADQGGATVMLQSATSPGTFGPPVLAGT